MNETTEYTFLGLRMENISIIYGVFLILWGTGVTTGILAIFLQPLPWKLWLIAAGFGGILIGWFINYLMKEGKNK